MGDLAMATNESTDNVEYIKELLMQMIDANKQISIAWRLSHDITHKSEHEALQKAENSVNVRLEAMNELRAQIERERGMFLLKDQYNERHEALVQRVSMEVERINGRITTEMERQSQRLELMVDALNRRVSEMERQGTVQTTKNEYALAQASSARQRMALALTAISVGIALITNFLFKRL